MPTTSLSPEASSLWRRATDSCPACQWYNVPQVGAVTEPDWISAAYECARCNHRWFSGHSAPMLRAFDRDPEAWVEKANAYLLKAEV
jgi:hypothetical protein